MDGLLVFFLSLLFSIPVGIITNLLTPKVQAGLATRSLSIRRKRLQTLIKAYKFIRTARISPSTITWMILRQIALGVYMLGLSVLFVGGLLLFTEFYPLTQLDSWQRTSYWNAGFLVLGAIVCGSFVTSSCFDAMELAIRAIKLDDFEKMVMSEIERLGGDIEQLLRDDMAQR